MRNGLLMLSAALALAATAKSEDATADAIELTIGEKGFDVPKSLWGIFFEDINWAADGGLNPEMLANGGFDWQQADHQNNPRDDRAWNSVEDGWEADFREGGMARLSFQYGAPVHPNTAKHLRIEAFGTGRAGVRNRGLDGMWLEAGEPYRLSYDWREVKLDGIDYALGAWKRETVAFTANGEAGVLALPSNERFDILLEPDRDRTTLSILVKGRRAVEFDNVSLQPTGPNLVRAGLRKDLVDKLADLKPAFVRFPGGCIVEEGDFQHWYDWRRTVGPKERRECIQNRWARPGKPYWETFGVGYYEYFRLCEEIGAEPLPICLAGLTCQFQKPPLMCAVEDVDYFANVILELIEFANGDVTTKWGKVRAEMGHPAPFNLKMIGIGNENWMEPFFDRCEPIAKILREKHPEIKIVGSSGPGPDGREFDFAWNRVTKASADVVDEHFYRDPNWFLRNAHRYDKYDRTNKPKVYAGEYACHHHIGGKKPNTLWSAVCEAAVMTGYERNSDVVEMASYAPLFARLGHDQWTPNMIWFDGTKSWATPNYHVQRLFSVHRPDETVQCTVRSGAVVAKPDLRGEIALQTWNTAVEFKDVEVIDGNGRTLLKGFSDLNACTRAAGGDWTLADGVLRQSRTDKTDTALTLPCGVVGDATVKMRVRRTAGAEGFLVQFRKRGGKYALANIGGWSNREHAFEVKGCEAKLPGHVQGSLENNRWYTFELRLKGDTAEVRLDGKPLLAKTAIVEGVAADFFQTCGFDRAAGEYVVKCVNASQKPRELTLAFGRDLPRGKVRSITLTGDMFAVNDVDHPNRLAPQERALDFAGGKKFTVTVPGVSVTILRLKK